jgi:hypothetical protein
MIKNGSYEDLLADAKHGVYDCTKNGKCSGCGDCCSNILPLMKKEIEEIKKYIKEHDIKRQEHRSFFLSADTIDMVCPFCDTTKELKCTIYPVRPSICKIFLCSNAAKRRVHLSDAGRRDINMSKVFFGGGETVGLYECTRILRCLQIYD